jgi:hypothetical protein
VLALVSASAHGTITFERTYTWHMGHGHGESFSIEQLADLGYILVGIVDDSVDMGASLIRVDSLGDTLWFRMYKPPSGGGGGNGVCVTLDNCFVIAGDKGGVGVSDAWAVKVDSLGDTVWTYTYAGPGYDYFAFVAATRDTGTIFCGRLNTGSSFGMALAKLTRDGQLSWHKVYEPANPDASSSGGYCFETPDGGYLAFGVFAAPWPGDTISAYLVRTDSIGDTVWTSSFRPLLRYIESGSMCMTYDGGCAVCVTTTGKEGSVGSLVKLDSLGDSLWGRILFRDSAIHRQLWLSSVQETPDHGFVIVGYLEREGGAASDTSRVLLVRLDSLGDTLWTREFDGLDPGECDHDRGYWVVNTKDGGFAIAGTADRGLAYLIKTDSLGLVEVGTEEPRRAAPALAMAEARPNPAKDEVRIRWQLPVEAQVSLRVYNAAGRLVKVLADGRTKPGAYTSVWNGTDAEGRRLTNGVYFYALDDGAKRISGKLVLTE